MPHQLSLFRGKRQRGVRLPPAKEYEVHCLVADTLKKWCHPDWRYHHSPSGEKRDIVTAARIKRMGAVPGFPDFILFSPRKTYLLELKREGSGRLSDEQQSFADYFDKHDHPYAVAWTFSDAMAILKHWGAVRVTVSA